MSVSISPEEKLRQFRAAMIDAAMLLLPNAKVEWDHSIVSDELIMRVWRGNKDRNFAFSMAELVKAEYNFAQRQRPFVLAQLQKTFMGDGKRENEG